MDLTPNGTAFGNINSEKKRKLIHIFGVSATCYDIVNRHLSLDYRSSWCLTFFHKKINKE